MSKVKYLFAIVLATGLFMQLIPFVLSAEKAERLSWLTLRKLKKRNKIPPNLARFDGKNVRLRGFMVPLNGDDGGNLTEFLLVPGAGQCIHTPPPPPNQIVFVRMQKGKVAEHTWEVVRVTGKFTIASRVSHYGSASYQIDASGVR